MNHGIYLASVWLHIVAACAWIGGMLFMSLVLVPALKRMGNRPLAVELIRESGRRFRLVGWTCLAVLVATGIENLNARGITWSLVQTPAFWQSAFGQVLAFKLVTELLILTISAAHDFRIGPRAGVAMRADPGSPDARRYRTWAMLFGRVNLLLALIVAVCGVMLVRGRPW